MWWSTCQITMHVHRVHPYLVTQRALFILIFNSMSFHGLMHACITISSWSFWNIHPDHYWNSKQGTFTHIKYNASMYPYLSIFLVYPILHADLHSCVIMCCVTQVCMCMCARAHVRSAYVNWPSLCVWLGVEVRIGRTRGKHFLVRSNGLG